MKPKQKYFFHRKRKKKNTSLHTTITEICSFLRKAKRKNKFQKQQILDKTQTKALKSFHFDGDGGAASERNLFWQFIIFHLICYFSCTVLKHFSWKLMLKIK
jgi:hypothetical protein